MFQNYFIHIPEVQQYNHNYALSARGDSVFHYNKDAKRETQHSWDKELRQDDLCLIKGIVRNPDKNCNELFDLVQKGKIMILDEGKGLSFEQLNEDRILFHAFIPKPIGGEIKDVLQKGKNWLLSAFSGWHHIYHEVFAAANELAIQPL